MTHDNKLKDDFNELYPLLEKHNARKLKRYWPADLHQANHEKSSF